MDMIASSPASIDIGDDHTGLDRDSIRTAFINNLY